jgi:hypothetical protein
VQRPLTQTVPCAQLALVVQVWVQPFVVQTSPFAQSSVLLHELGVGGDTVEHP